MACRALNSCGDSPRCASASIPADPQWQPSCDHFVEAWIGTSPVIHSTGTVGFTSRMLFANSWGERPLRQASFKPCLVPRIPSSSNNKVMAFLSSLTAFHVCISTRQSNYQSFFEDRMGWTNVAIPLYRWGSERTQDRYAGLQFEFLTPKPVPSREQISPGTGTCGRAKRLCY
jgi:hypothetical protein